MGPVMTPSPLVNAATPLERAAGDGNDVLQVEGYASEAPVGRDGEAESSGAQSVETTPVMANGNSNSRVQSPRGVS